jgi:HD superfamily phosphodiesterase
MFEKQIRIALDTWQHPVLDYLNVLYAGKWIPSHDIFHHERVWRNAVAILPWFRNEIPVKEPGFFQQLLLSCFFHDTGLLFDKGFRHGLESAKICTRFMQESSHQIAFDKECIIRAIAKHDEKNYSSARPDQFTLIHKILTLADDIDAFGAVGAYRYAEIYLTRGIPAEKIPGQIVANSDERYRNLVRFGLDEMKDIRKKFEILKAIYSEDTFKSPPAELPDLINRKVIIRKNDPSSVFRGLIGEFETGSRTHYFLARYNEEWRTFTEAE